MLHHASPRRRDVEIDGDGEVARLSLVVVAAVIGSGSLCSDAVRSKGGTPWLPSSPLFRPPSPEPAIGAVILR